METRQLSRYSDYTNDWITDEIVSPSIGKQLSRFPKASERSLFRPQSSKQLVRSSLLPWGKGAGARNWTLFLGIVFKKSVEFTSCRGFDLTTTQQYVYVLQEIRYVTTVVETALNIVNRLWISRPRFWCGWRLPSLPVQGPPDLSSNEYYGLTPLPPPYSPEVKNE